MVERSFGKLSRACGALLFILTAFAGQPLWCQSAAAAPAAIITTDAKTPAYDVVSIKPNKTGSGRVSIHVDDGNFDAFNVSLGTMIQNAYGLKEAQLFGLPKWGDSARFDIKAKIVDPDMKAIQKLTPEQFGAMLQPMLMERFQLKFHREVRTLPVYELTVLKSGAKFKESTATGDMTVNGVRAGGMNVHNRALTATAVPMARLVDNLSAQLRRIVVDKTGMAGNYDWQLTWAPDDAGPQDPDAVAPSIFTALQEQLGLKLVPGKAEVDAFVVDSADLPGED